MRVNHKYDFVMTHYELLTVVASLSGSANTS
ncbi:MAG: hypothetical protein ACI89T_002125 [Cognaticolwellia sp.]